MKNKKVAIMQPYFLPYVGYFQLISAVDVYLNLDHVNFMKRSYMTRNLLKNNVDINLQVCKSSQNIACNKTYVNFEHNYIERTIKKLQSLYSSTENYSLITQTIILPELYQRSVTISSFNIGIIKRICQYLDIKTIILDSSEPFNEGLVAEDGIINITKRLEGKIYVNAIGGQKIYSKENFESKGIQLQFIKMKEPEIKDPYLSILHHLFVYPKETIKENLEKYEIL